MHKLSNDDPYSGLYSAGGYMNVLTQRIHEQKCCYM